MPVLPGSGSGNSTISVQDVFNFARTMSKMIPIIGVGGFSSQPGLTIANNVLQELMSAPFNWKFNRVDAPFFVTRPFVQDYRYSGATAFVLSPNGTAYGGGVGIELAANNGLSESGTTVTCITLDPHPFIVGQTVYINGATVLAYNSTFTQSTTKTQWSGGYVITSVADSFHFTFTHPSSGLGISGGAGVSDFGWLEAVSFQDIQSTATPQPIRDGQAVKNLARHSITGNSEKLAMITDEGTGIIRFRLYLVPGTYLWAVYPVYQSKAIQLTLTTQTWTPFPDQLQFVINQGFITQSFRFADDPRYVNEYKIWQQMIAKGLGIEDAEQTDEGFYPMRSIMIG